MTLLDRIDGEPDLEDGGDDEENGDREPSLGWTPDAEHRGKYGPSDGYDLEHEHDGQEPDADFEPSLGSLSCVGFCSSWVGFQPPIDRSPYWNQELWAYGDSTGRDIEDDPADGPEREDAY